MIEDEVDLKIFSLRGSSQKHIGHLKAFLVCILTAAFSVIPVISGQFSIVENLSSQSKFQLEVQLIFILFISVFYIIAIIVPLFCGFQLFSGITFTSLIVFSGFIAFVESQFGQVSRFGGQLFLLAIGILIAWLGEIAFAIGIIVVYSFWRRIGYFIVLTISSLTIPLIATTLAYIPPQSGLEDVLVTCLLAIPVLVTSAYIAKKALREDPVFIWVKHHAIAFSVLGGISFSKLDLENRNFENLDLSYVDFRESRIYHTNFKGSKNLEFACVQGTILADPKVRKLLTIPKLCGIFDKNFSYLNLMGADLRSLDLEGVDFTATNLTDVDFSDANLTGANFTNAQLFNANFSRACLNQVCICDWAINQKTCFNHTECNWVYLKQGKYGPQEKKPDIAEFQPGEFEKWIRQLQDTIDIILREQPNVRALTKAIEKVVHDHSGLDPSRFSIESKGENLYVARVGTTPEADKALLARTIIINYNSINQLMVQGESNRLLLNSGKTYMEAKNQNISAGSNVDMSSGTRVNIGGDVIGSSITLGELNGQVSNAVQSLSDIETSDGQNLAEVFAALQSTINEDKALSEPQKTQAMEAVATLAEEAHKPKDKRLVKLCSMAVNALKGISSSLTDVSKLAAILETHLPTLINFFGIHS